MKYLVITGGSKGIGKACITSFMQQDYRILNISRSPNQDANVINIDLDLKNFSDYSKLETIFAKELKDASQVCFIHNAGLLINDNIFDTNENLLLDSFSVNVIAAQKLTTLLLPFMKEGSSLLFVGSTLSEKAVSNALSYVTTKHALVGLMRAICQDLIGKSIHTACICPGFTDTEMLRNHVDNREEILDSIRDGVTFKRLIQPSEIANLLFDCAKSPVINGSVIHANLGQIES